MLSSAKPVEVANSMYALRFLAAPGEQTELLTALAACAQPAALPTYSSRHMVTLLSTVGKLEATSVLSEGQLNAWVVRVRQSHAQRPLLALDQRTLETALDALNLNKAWVRQSAMLSAWSDLSQGRSDGRRRQFTEADLCVVFEAIDTDGSGGITANELKEAIAVVDATVDDAAIARMLDFADVDGNREVSLEEFMQMMQPNIERDAIAKGGAVKKGGAVANDEGRGAVAKSD